MESFIHTALAVLLGAFVGSYLAAYMKRKGENLATHEDIDKLVDQVSAVTIATKQIEAKISDEVWNRQKRWEMKREVFFSAAKALAQVDEALLKYGTVHNVVEDRNDPKWVEAIYERSQLWQKASAALDETRMLIAVVCGRETQRAFDELAVLTNNVIAAVTKDKSAYAASQGDLAKKIFAVRMAMRKELDVDMPN
jgi:hypothetical protein